MFYGHIKSLTPSGGRYVLRFDPAWLLEGTTGQQAAVADGVLPPGEPVPNDNYTRDESHKLLTFLVPRTARITVADERRHEGHREHAGDRRRVRADPEGQEPESPRAVRPQPEGLGLLGRRPHRHACARSTRSTTRSYATSDGRAGVSTTTSPRSTTASTASTTRGSNCVPGTPQLGDRRVERQRLAVGAVGRHRVERVAARDDARGERDRLAGEAVRIAAAVVVLVRGADDGADAAEQAADAREHRLAVDRVRRMTAHSSSLSGPRLLMISFGTWILPTSWSSAANSASRRVSASTPSSSRDREHELDDLLAVRAGVRVVGLDHVAEQERGAAVGLSELERVVDPRPRAGARTAPAGRPAAARATKA